MAPSDAPHAESEHRRRSRVRTVLDVDQTIVKLDQTADRLNETLDTFGTLLADFTRALNDFNASVQGFNGTVDNFQGVVDKADGIMSRAEVMLAPLVATQQVGDRLKAATSAAGIAASSAVRRGTEMGKGLTGKG